MSKRALNMETKCRVWKQNTYDIHNLIVKQEYRKKLTKIIKDLLNREQSYHDHQELYTGTNKTIHYPTCLGIKEMSTINHSLYSADLFHKLYHRYNGNNYEVQVVVERDVGLFPISPSNSKRISITVSCSNNEDSIQCNLVIPYVYENKRLLTLGLDSTYNMLVNLYKDYGH